MTKTILTTIRILLSVALLVGVYAETGVWTTLAILLLGVSIEITARVVITILENLNNGSL